jgi:hypothetical protein
LLRAAGGGFGFVTLTKSSQRRFLVETHLLRAVGGGFGGVTLVKAGGGGFRRRSWCAKSNKRRFWWLRTC